MDGVRAPRMARLIATAVAALAVACIIAPRAARADFQRGVDYTAYTADAYGAPPSDASLVRLAQDGNSDVSIVVTVYQANSLATDISAASCTPTDASILHAMQTARSLGLRVTLKPQIDLFSGGWRGGIRPLDPAAWFTSYEAIADHYADLARAGGASMYVVGTELKTMTVPGYTARWEQLIADVRQRFSGQLTYAANFDEFRQVGFWRDLDYVGVDAYFPLASTSDQPVPALLSAWGSRGYLAALQNVSVMSGRPVLFTEVGYRSVVGATIHPNIWNSTAPYDMQEQANAYESVYEALAAQPWFAGLYWWSWPAALPPSGWNGDYTPTFKPAESVMTSWNARLAAPVAPVAPVAPAAAAPAAAPAAAAAPPSRKVKRKASKHAHRKTAKRHHRKRHRRARGRHRRHHHR